MNEDEHLSEITFRARAYKQAHSERDRAILAAIEDGVQQVKIAEAVDVTASAIRKITRKAGL